MPFDAELVLRGKYSSALVNLDEADVVAVTTDVNSDGNAVIDVKGTGNKGLTAVLILTEAADSQAYDDEGTILIEASDELDRHWKEVARFPTFHSHIRKIYITVTTPFVAADVTTPRHLIETGSSDTGEILYISDELFNSGGQGYVLVEMDDSGDTFAQVVGTVETASGGTGIGTKTKATESGLSIQMQPGLYTVQFKTNKRYVRFNGETIEDNMGDAWCLLTNHYDEIDSDLG